MSASCRSRAALRALAARTDRHADELLARAVERLPLSGRGRARVARVARTIAALAGSAEIGGRARCRGALVSLAVGARSPMSNELAMAMFAAARDAHAVDRDRTTRSFAAFAASFDEQAELRRLTDAGYRWIGRSAHDFPARLRSIHDPPPGLFVRGTAETALVARRALRWSVRGRAATTAHTSRGRSPVSWPPPGVVVVSGLARGIDGWAHRAASRRAAKPWPCSVAGSTATIRVRTRPGASDREHGLIVSEYPPGVAPAPWRFPARNRIVGGPDGARP